MSSGVGCSQTGKLTLPSVAYSLNPIYLLSTAAESLPLDVQDAEENFDLALLSTLEVDVLPHLGSVRIPDYVITQFARILYAASALHADGTREEGVIVDEEYATTESAQSVPRERFAYWAFDLLVLVCAVVETGELPPVF